MKVLHVVPYLPPPDFVVKDIEYSEKLADIECSMTKANKKGGWKRLPLVLANMVLKAIQFLRFRPNVIHCHFMTTTIPAALSSIPAVVTIHESWPWYPFWWKPFIKLATRRCKIIYISQHNRNMWQPIIGKDGKVISHAIDTDIFHPDQLDAEYRSKLLTRLSADYLVMLMGPFSPKRAYHVAIKACKSLRDEELNVGIVFKGYGGTAWYKKYLENLLEDLEVPSLMITERLTEMNLARLYASSDVFVRPGVAEGFGIAPLEAQGCGTPLIVSNCASLKELYSESALVFEPMNQEDLKEKIRTALLDSEVRMELISKGLKNASKYSWDKKIRQYVKRYLEAIDSS